MENSSPEALCRLCSGSSFRTILNLGELAHAGIFPDPGVPVPTAPLHLLQCESCGLVQLEESSDPDLMYGENYGYASSLNPTMVQHLEDKAERLVKYFSEGSLHTALDIGSNDGTFLNALSPRIENGFGFDPVAVKYESRYRSNLSAVGKFFSASEFSKVSARKADLITSIAMFYDLEDPVHFARDIRDSLAPEGIWHFEQSYLPTMLAKNSYDTICQEHLEYYSLNAIHEILTRANLRIIDVGANQVNGGSLAVSAVHASSVRDASPVVSWWLYDERASGAIEFENMIAFRERVDGLRDSLFDLVVAIRSSGKSVAGLGASTKGNTILQYSGLTHAYIDEIFDVNPDKFGKVTPGTSIPIAPESEIVDRMPDYLLVLPWHFRDFLIERLRGYILKGGRLIFPLPQIEIFP